MRFVLPRPLTGPGEWISGALRQFRVDDKIGVGTYGEVRQAEMAAAALFMDNSFSSGAPPALARLLLCAAQVFKAWDGFANMFVALKRIKTENEKEGSWLVALKKCRAWVSIPSHSSSGLLFRFPTLLLSLLLCSLNPTGFPITALREVKILRQLKHENIVNLLGIVSDKDRPEEHVADLENDGEQQHSRDFYMVCIESLKSNHF